MRRFPEIGSVGVEYLDALVRAVRNVQSAFRIGDDRMRDVELARPGALCKAPIATGPQLENILTKGPGRPSCSQRFVVHGQRVCLGGAILLADQVDPWAGSKLVHAPRRAIGESGATGSTARIGDNARQGARGIGRENPKTGPDRPPARRHGGLDAAHRAARPFV